MLPPLSTINFSKHETKYRRQKKPFIVNDRNVPFQYIHEALAAIILTLDALHYYSLKHHFKQTITFKNYFFSKMLRRIVK